MLKYYNYDIVFQEIPNEVTLAINITNCPNRCKGCHSPHLQKDIGETLDNKTLIRILNKYVSSITCLCFMGGDASPIEITRLAEFLHSKYPKIKTAWYSGWDKIPKKINYKVFNYIKLGRYSADSGPINNPGSNQHLFEIQPDGIMSDISYLFRTF